MGIKKMNFGGNKRTFLLIVLLLFGISFFIGFNLTGNFSIPLTNSSIDTNLTQETGFAYLNISDSNLIFYAPFDSNIGATTVFDYTDNSNDGTIVGATFDPNGVYGGAYSFDGVNDYIDIGLSSPAELNLPGNMTISVWIKLDNVATGAKAIVCDYDQGTSNSQFALEVNRISGKISTLYAGYAVGLYGTTTLVIDTWYHVVLTRSGSFGNWDYNIYLDGVNDGSAHTTVNPNAQQGSAIGRYGELTSSLYFFPGNIDEVMIFNKGLSSGEVSAIYNNQSERFFPTGEKLFENLNFSEGISVDVTLDDCQTLLGSRLTGKVNDGPVNNFTGCGIQNYRLSGVSDLESVNFTVGYVSDTYGFYTPLIIGNVTFKVNKLSANVTQETNFTHLNISDPNLVFYTPFDSNISATTVFDYTENSNDGTIVGATFDSSGIIGGAYSFDGGSDKISFGDVLDFETTDPFSISAWIKPDAVSGYQMIVTKSEYGGTYKGYIFYLSHNNLAFALIHSGGNYIDSWTNTDSLVADNWHHLVATYDGSETASGITLYLEGLGTGMDIKKDTLAPGDTTLNSFPLLIGARHPSAELYEGVVDEVMIFNKELSSGEVLEIYNNQSERFFPTGEKLFENLNFSRGISLNITLDDCQTLLGSRLTGKVNDGPVNNFTGCGIQDYSLSGVSDLENVNFTIGYISDTDGFYTPLVIGNVTFNLSVNFPPIVQTVNITSSAQDGSADLVGLCNATDANNDNLTYYFEWYLNNVIDTEGNIGNFSAGSEVNIGNISSSSLTNDDVWILGCLAKEVNSLNSSWVNSSEFTITPETLCADGIDNDGDSFIDCFDSDCSSDSNCVSSGLKRLSPGAEHGQQSNDRKVWSKIYKGEKAEISFSQGAFQKITFEAVGKDIRSLTLVAKEESSFPAGSPSFDHPYYKIIEIKETFTGGTIGNVEIEFKIEKQWFTDQGFSKEEISLYRLQDDWVKQDTSILNEDAVFVYYSTIPEGLSLFVIGVSKEAKIEEVPEEEEIPVITKRIPKQGLIGLAILLLVLIVGGLIKKYVQHRKKKSKRRKKKKK